MIREKLDEVSRRMDYTEYLLRGATLVVGLWFPLLVAMLGRPTPFIVGVFTVGSAALLTLVIGITSYQLVTWRLLLEIRREMYD